MRDIDMTLLFNVRCSSRWVYLSDFNT